MIRHHEYNIGQEVWFYTTDTLEVHHGIVDDIEFDDEDNNYVYEVNTNAVPDEDDRIYHAYPSAMRSTEFEAHDLLRDYLEICMDGTSKTMDKYQKLRDREWYWIQAHHDEAPYA